MKPKRISLIRELIMPSYDGLSLFLMSLSFLLVFFNDAELKSISYNFFISDYDPRYFPIYAVVLLFVAGCAFSLYQVFSKAPKTDSEKTAMLYFAVVANGFSGAFAGIHMLGSFPGILLVFPVWNIVNGFLLLLMYRFGIVDESNILNIPATHLDIIVGFIGVLVTFVICRFVFNLYWAFTFSICISYATNLDSVVNRFLPRKAGRVINEI